MEGNGIVSTSTEDLQQEVQDLRREHEVQSATQAGAQSTQAAAQAGQASTFAASQMGTVTTMAAGWVGMVVGMFLGLAVANSRR